MATFIYATGQPELNCENEALLTTRNATTSMTSTTVSVPTSTDIQISKSQDDKNCKSPATVAALHKYSPSLTSASSQSLLLPETTNSTKNILDTIEQKMELMQKNEKEIEQMQMLMQNERLSVTNLKDGYSTYLYSSNEQDGIKRDRQNSVYDTFCLLCGEQFESKLRLSLHMLQEHSTNSRATKQSINQSYKFPLDALSSINLKVEKFQLNRTPAKDVCETVTSNKQMSQEVEGEGNTSSILAEMSSFGVTCQSTAPTNTTTIQSSKYWPLFNISAINSFEDDNRPPHNRIFNSEAFCDLCNKEFCNKYFLKTHKANKHGIYDLNTESASNCFNNNTHIYNPLSTQRRELNFFTNHQQAAAFDRHYKNFEYFSLKQSALFDTTSTSFAADENVICNSLQVDKIRNMLNTTQKFLFEQEEFSFIPQPRKLSPRSEQRARETNFTEDELRLLGIVNPDAFCNLCCKEYCNEYFLSVHKWKQHEEAVSIHDMNFLQNYSIWPFINPSIAPRNLTTAMEDSYVTQSKKRIKLELTEVNSNTEAACNRENENDSTNPEECLMKRESDMSQLLPEDVSNKTLKESTRHEYIQKLQTMFQQIKNNNTKNTFNCPVCGIETENPYQLQLHLISEHNTNSGFIPNKHIQIPSFSSRNSILSKSHKELYCTQCECEFNSLLDFQKHIKETHLLTTTTTTTMTRTTIESPQRDSLDTTERSNQPAVVNVTEKPPCTVTPISSYCDICNKELCNKYFMKTHMQRMHGIEIENGAHIGGVVCNICNKELCSKYFLRVHKHNTHGITDEGLSFIQQNRQNGINVEIGSSSQSTQKSQYKFQPEHQLTSAQQIQPQIQILDDGGGGGNNENLNLKISSPQIGTLDYKSSICTPPQTIETDKTTCPICGKAFTNSMWLSSHLIADHSTHSAIACDALKRLEQPFPLYDTDIHESMLSTRENNGNDIQKSMQNLTKKSTIHSHDLQEYRCAVCPFTTLYYAFLFIHERTHYFLNSGVSNLISHINKEVESQNQQLENIKNDVNNVGKNYLEKPTSDDDKSMSISRIQSNESTDHNNPSQYACNSTKLTQEDNGIQEKHSRNRRSIASSPILSMTQQLMQDVTWKTGQIATYSLPQQNPKTSNQCDSIQMQAFEIEETKIREECNLSKTFLPAIVYLPVKERINSSVSVTFNLTPT